MLTDEAAATGRPTDHLAYPLEPRGLTENTPTAPTRESSSLLHYACLGALNTVYCTTAEAIAHRFELPAAVVEAHLLALEAAGMVSRNWDDWPS